MKPKFWRVITTPSSIVCRPLFDNTYVVHHCFPLIPLLVQDGQDGLAPKFQQLARPATNPRAVTYSPAKMEVVTRPPNT